MTAQEQNEQPRVVTRTPLKPSPTKARSTGKKILLILCALLVVMIVLVVVRVSALGSKVFVHNGSFWKQVQGVVSSGSDVSLQGESSNRINILLLGYGGAGHDGPYLTDTMILASIQPQSKIIDLYSVPRDYYYPTSVGDKLNAVYAEKADDGKDPLDAGVAAEQAIGGITGQTIPYFASLDFTGFQEAIDDIGGVDVDVPDTFTDYTFPNDATNGYLPPLTFTAGEQHMDGTRALEFARSRHAAGPEGSDFARSRRQQLVISAFKQKLTQTNAAQSPTTVINLITTLASHFDTNMDPIEVKHLVQLLTSSNYTVITKNLDVTTSLICNSILPSDGAYILQPCDGVTSSDIQNFFAVDTADSAAQQQAIAAAESENASVILENADPTNAATNTLYAGLKKELAAANVTEYDVTYHGGSISQSTVYYKNSKPNTQTLITQYLGNGVIAQPLPSSLTAASDIVVFVQAPQQ